MPHETFINWPNIPDDPWPKIVPLQWAEELLAKANLPFSHEEIGNVLATCLDLEMRAAGECAAMAALAGVDGLFKFELQFHSRVRGEAAARLLTAYEIVYRQAQQRGPSLLLAPGQVKEDATSSFREQFLDHCGRHLLHEMVQKNKRNPKSSSARKKKRVSGGESNSHVSTP